MTITPAEQAILTLIPDVVRCSKSRRTRAMLAISKLAVSTYDRAQVNQLKRLPVQFNGGSGEWLCCCLTHAQAKLFSKGRDAYAAVGNPEVFCVKCNEYTSE